MATLEGAGKEGKAGAEVSAAGAEAALGARAGKFGMLCLADGRHGVKKMDCI